jgi:hypothetical protein
MRRLVQIRSRPRREGYGGGPAVPLSCPGRGYAISASVVLDRLALAAAPAVSGPQEGTLKEELGRGRGRGGRSAGE